MTIIFSTLAVHPCAQDLLSAINAKRSHSVDQGAISFRQGILFQNSSSRRRSRIMDFSKFGGGGGPN